MLCKSFFRPERRLADRIEAAISIRENYQDATDERFGLAEKTDAEKVSGRLLRPLYLSKPA
jgi:hypothetical protein